MPTALPGARARPPAAVYVTVPVVNLETSPGGSGGVRTERSRRIPPPDLPPTAFDLAAARLIAAPRGGARLPGAKATAADFRLVATTLERYARGFRLTDDDAEEIVAGVLAETISRTAAQNDAVREPAAYLFWTTRNRALDHLRRAKRHPTESLDERVDAGKPWHSDEDDAIVRMLEQGATTEIVESALRAAVAANDLVVARVVSVWIELAEAFGRAPTSREVAPAADTSHTTVGNALRRFTRYLPPADE